MNCNLVMSISAMACAIAKDKDADEIALISAVLVQLGDCLATIGAQDSLCNKKDTDE